MNHDELLAAQKALREESRKYVIRYCKRLLQQMEDEGIKPSSSSIQRCIRKWELLQGKNDEEADIRDAILGNCSDHTLNEARIRLVGEHGEEGYCYMTTYEQKRLTIPYVLWVCLLNVRDEMEVYTP